MLPWKAIESFISNKPFTIICVLSTPALIPDFHVQWTAQFLVKCHSCIYIEQFISESICCNMNSLKITELYSIYLPVRFIIPDRLMWKLSISVVNGQMRPIYIRALLLFPNSNYWIFCIFRIYVFIHVAIYMTISLIQQWSI